VTIVASIMTRMNDLLRRGRPAADGAATPPTRGLSKPVKLSNTVKLAKPGPPRGRHLVYSPRLDGRADPGEIVWTWVPYEEDHSQGKDRPVLVVGRNGTTLLGLMMSSSAARDGQQDWYALGSGPWDHEHRPSWVRMDRVLRVKERGIRREGAVLSRDRFDTLSKQLRMHYGWQ
jgi:PemK-like, MazF-like toxin of type II toxin-antitoxin system